MRKSLAFAVAPAVVATGLLAGCAQSPSTAATVGNARITEAQVSEVAARVEALGFGSAVEARPMVLSMLINGEQLKQIRAAHPEATVDAAVHNREMAGLDPKALADEKLRNAAAGNLDFQLAAQSLGDKALPVIMEVPVTLNPRYGIWDQSQQAVALTNNSLATKWMPRATR